MPIVSIIDQLGNVLRTFDVKENEIIFNALEDQGHSLPHGCLAGSCSVCRIEIIEGNSSISEVSTIEKDTLSSFRKKHPEYENKSIRLSCRAKILGDISIRPIP